VDSTGTLDRARPSLPSLTSTPEIPFGQKPHGAAQGHPAQNPAIWLSASAPNGLMASGPNIQCSTGQIPTTTKKRAVRSPDAVTTRAPSGLHGRVRLTDHDRLFFIQLYRWFPAIGQVLTIIRRETLLRWHRTGFRCYWRWKSRPRGGRPKIDTELRLLIRRMSENPHWGAPPIHGELLKLGFKVAQSSVAKYMAKRRGPPSHARHGHPRQACRTSLAPAEWLCRTSDRVDPARVFGSCGDLGRGAFASDPEIYARYYNETRLG
jgi:hypothetical protein